jgi:hypothetical protein
MVQFDKQTHFFSRNSTGRHPLDVREIKAAFLGGTAVAERIRRFRDNRLGLLIADQGPAKIPGPKLIVHLCPLQEETTSVAKISLVPLADPRGWSSRFNLDGFLAFESHGAGYYSYSLAFHSGAFEGVRTVLIRTDPPHLYGVPIEDAVIQGVKQYYAASQARRPGPVSVLVSLVGVLGVNLVFDQHEYRPVVHTIDRDVLILPDVLIEPGNIDIAVALRPIFDALWQSSGRERSPSYKSDGTLDPQVRR